MKEKVNSILCSLHTSMSVIDELWKLAIKKKNYASKRENSLNLTVK